MSDENKNQTEQQAAGTQDAPAPGQEGAVTEHNAAGQVANEAGTQTVAQGEPQATVPEDNKDEIARLRKDSETLTHLVNNAKFQQWYSQELEAERNRQPEAPKEPEPTEDEIAQVYGTRQAYDRYKALESKVNTLAAENARLNGTVARRELTEVIYDYSKTPGNEDFESLHKLGIIAPLVKTLKSENPKADNAVILKEAHARARKVVESIRSEAKNIQQKEIENKKSGSIEKGISSGSPTKSVGKPNRSLWEIAQENAERLNMKLE